MQRAVLTGACIVLLAVLAFSAGCTSFPSTGNATAATITTVPVETPALPQPAASPAPAIPATAATIVPTGTTTVIIPVPTATFVHTTYDATGDPRIIILQFEKDYFRAELPDCGMRASFPEVAADPEYGILAPNTKLTAYSEDQIVDFLRANKKPLVTEFRGDPYITEYIDPNTLGGVNCTGVAAAPTWNFVLINATIMPRNARPSEYAIGFDIRSRGRVVAQLRADRTLTLDQPEIFALFVPVKTSEMEFFDGVAMVFAKKR